MADTFGKYVIHEELGAGGLATVHLASTPAVSNPVALKRLYPHIAGIRELVAGFIDEARLARYLRHPNIARVHEFGRLGGIYYIAFEFVPGPTVQQLQQQCAAQGIRVPVPVVLEISTQLCDALDHAHNLRDERGLPLGIVHRDVSPSNLIVSNSGLVKLIDFGLAKTKQSTVQSQAGVIKGKLSYVAPEYLRGNLDSRCDLWAAGVIMHELLTGQRLFDASDDLRVLERVRAMPIPPPSRLNPEISPELDEIVLKALHRSPGYRWPTAAAMRAALVAHAGTRPLTKPQLVAWMEWALSQTRPPGQDGAVSALHEIIETGQIEVIGDLPGLSGAMLERRRESVAMIPVVAPAHPAAPRTSRRWLWLVLLLLVLAAGIAVAAS